MNAVFWIANLAGLGAAYLFGSLPTGYLAGRLLKGIDIRRQGSGSTGATNVLRILGKGPGAAVLLIDLLKGVAAILFVGWFTPWLWTLPFIAAPGGLTPQIWTPWVVSLAGLAVLVGHSRSVWLGFTGGKSAAAGLGVLLAISWQAGLGAAVAVLVVLALSRIVSLSSMIGAATAMVLVCVLDHPLAYRILVIAGGLFVIALHRANIRRLLAGTEPRFGQSSPVSTAPP